MEITRRTFLKHTGGGTLLAVMPPTFAASAASSSTPLAAAGGVEGAIITPVDLTINGAKHSLEIEPRAVLLDVLRENIGLCGTKKGCDHGQCGACTVLVNGRRVLSCLTLAVSHHGDEITTIEGLAKGDELHPMQTAFLDHDAYQCGYCTSGQIMSAVALAREPIGRGDAAVREAMSGNICRCGAYKNICAAIQSARGHRPV